MTRKIITQQNIVSGKPEKPAPNECCGGGSCCPCVWDDYFEKLENWNAQNELKKENERQANDRK